MGLKLIGTHQLLFHNDDLNVFGASIHTIWQNTEASIFTSNENGLELMIRKLSIWPCLENSMQCKITTYIYVGNKSFERVEHFKYFGTALTYQNSFHE